MRHKSIACLFALVFAATLGLANTSLAQDTGDSPNELLLPPIPPQNNAAFVFGGISLLGAIVMVSADIIQASESRWVSPIWAWPQLGVAAMNVGSAIWSFSSQEGSPGMAAANIAVATMMITHSVLSLSYYDAPKGDSLSDDRLSQLWPTILSDHTGAGITWGGQF